MLAAAGLLLAVAAAWLLNRMSPSGAIASNGKPAKEVAKAADVKDAAKASAKGAGPVPVEVIELKPSKVEEDLSAVGTLRSNESVLLRPEVSGRVETIGFRDGAPVKKGQLLIGLDAALNEAEVAQARAELDLAASNLKRTEDLARKAFVSSSAQEQAASNVEVLVARLKLAQARAAKMRIVAPFDGVAGIRTVSIGDYVKDGADLVNIEDIRTLKADFRLPERYFTQLQVGQQVEVVADALVGATYTGTVDAINPRIDANGRSLEVRARLTNTDGRLRPGMFARVRVILGHRAAALLVPEEAIVPLGSDFYVFTVNEGTARRSKVKLGVRRDAQVELLDGVKAGDQVIVAGMRVQRDGQPVRVVTAPGAGRPPSAAEAKPTEAAKVP